MSPTPQELETILQSISRIHVTAEGSLELTLTHNIGGVLQEQKQIMGVAAPSFIRQLIGELKARGRIVEPQYEPDGSEAYLVK